MKKIILILFSIFLQFSFGEVKEDVKTLKVMTWNIWGRYNQAKRYYAKGKSARTRTIEIIKDSGADVIAMIETYGSSKEIAKKLGFYYYTPSVSANLCIFSRYPLKRVSNLKGLSSFSFIRGIVKIPIQKNGEDCIMNVQIYCIWLTSGGRHIFAVKDKNVSNEKFVAGDNNRYQMIKNFLNHSKVKKSIRVSDNTPVIVAGDFNCVSAVDFTEETKQKGLNFGRILKKTPTHQAMIDLDFVDTYRFTNPKITKETLGYTWTTVGSDYDYFSSKGFMPVKKSRNPEYREGYARIDYIYSLGKKLQPLNSKVIKYYKNYTKRSFVEFPSDHAAVLTEFKINK